MNMEINHMLREMFEKNASDLHIAVNSKILMRIDENLIPISEKILTDKEATDLIYSLLTKEQVSRFEKELELDSSYEIKGLARFRINVYKERTHISAAIRLIPFEILTFEQCGLPVKVVTELCNKPKGLVLITGATGSGKSTTLAAMVNYINEKYPCHIITVEDPIEFVHDNKKSLVSQREVLYDTMSFNNSLKHVLRQDPDVILIGEMRDLETIESALIIAETGHLVFATLHTSDCAQTINRIIDVFPAHQQQQIRTQLSFVLLGIMSQQLVPKITGKGRVLCSEIMIANSAVRSLIREGKVHQMYSVIQTGQKEGMRTMNQSLTELYLKGLISYEDAISRSSAPDELEKLIVKK